jgi:branched-chain amino acid transport system permease protein
MLQYLIAGIATGGVYALSSMALVITYNASRVLNFAQGAVAFLIAYVFFVLSRDLGVPNLVAGALAVFVVAPAVGFILWAVLLGRLSSQPLVVKLGATIGLQVALGGAVLAVFGHREVVRVKGLIPEPQIVFRAGGVAISDEQLLIIGVTLLVGLAGAFVLFRTRAGLIARGAVDSPLMTVLSGTNPRAVAAYTWMAGTALAGLAGILVLPQIGLNQTSFAQLTATSLAGVVIARLTSVWWAMAGSLLIGIVQSVVLPLLPADGLVASATRPSIPFVFMVLAILWHIRSGYGRDAAQTREVAVAAEAARQRLIQGLALLKERPGSWDRWVGWIVVAVAVVVVPVALSEFWLGTVVAGIAIAIVFASQRLITGEAGVVSLCQITFAGVGAVATGQFASELGLPVLLAVLLGAVAGGLFGAIVAAICIPLGQLFAAIATFAVALLADQTLFAYPGFSNFDSGVIVDRPTLFGVYLGPNAAYYGLVVGAFAFVALVLVRLRRSASGLAFACIRSGSARAETLGFELGWMRMAAFVGAAGIAALAGGLIASFQLVAFPPQFAAAAGLVWFAVSIAQGASSLGGAVLAGLSITVLPQLFSSYLPHRLGDVPAVLFGLAAILMVHNPDGVVIAQRIGMRRLAIKIEQLWRKPPNRTFTPELRRDQEHAGQGGVR